MLNNKGVAIILALVFIALLSVIVVEFLYESEVEASLASVYEGELEAYLSAKSAVAKGIAFLAEDLLNTVSSGAPPVDSDFDLLTFNMGASMEMMNNAIMHATISDEYGKINLNALLMPQSGGEPQERVPLVNALKEFFRLRDPGEGARPEDIVDAILDWLDYNDGDSQRPQGAENDYYMSLENPYPCKNGPMDSIEELLLIKGITPKIYFGDPEKNQLPLSEYLTVHGDWLGRVNVNSAQPEVISAMIAGFTNNPADIGVGQRIYDDAHTQPFTDLAQLDAYGVIPKTPVSSQIQQQRQPKAELPLFNQSSPARQDVQARISVSRMFTLQSNAFRICGNGLCKNKMVRIEAYIFRNPYAMESNLSLRDNSLNRARSSSKIQPSKQLASGGNIPSPDQRREDGTVSELPPEPFRILDWKVIK
ncbi:MAG: type II secretion system protein GspK [Candidatus Hydrogenedentes bacterium]|nr:type II secretion system protein GspK [Candidatus Hydrogenedentota bacterium]